MDRRDARGRHRAAGRGTGDLDPPRRRQWDGQGPVGAQRVVRVSERLRPRRGRGDARDRDLRADRRSVLGQLVEVHACRSGGCMAPRPAGRRARPRAHASRVLGKPRPFGPGARPVGDIEHAAARRPSRRRLRGGRRREPPRGGDGPAPRRPVAERGHPHRRPRHRRSRAPQPPSRADAHGRATRRWSARSATPPRSPRRRPRPPERRTMAGVHAPDRPVPDPRRRVAVRAAPPGRRPRDDAVGAATTSSPTTPPS